jgi:[ribosomal protein S5]-alanine N-acetyltransferase
MGMLVMAALDACGRRTLAIGEVATERLILHEMTDENFDAIHAYACDPEVCRFMEWGPNNPDDTRAFIARSVAEQTAKSRTSWNFVVRIRDNQKDGRDKIIGGCRIAIESEANKQASIGYVLAREEWGKGYATEVAKALVGKGFGRLGMHRIWAVCDSENLASAKVLLKIGMQYEGCLKHNKIIRGQWRDDHLYAIVRS